MQSDSNQPVPLYRTAKPHKFETLEDITVANLTMQQELYRIQYSINDSQKFPNMLSSIPPLQEDEEDVSFAVETLFTNIPTQETINYIIEQIYVYLRFSEDC